MMRAPPPHEVRRHTELTFKENGRYGRHGWLRLTPAYSVKVVDQVLAEFGAGARRVFEPFSGTGTTPLCAGYQGLEAVATDINPFLVWLGRVKGARYTPAQQAELLRCGDRIAASVRPGRRPASNPPPLKNIERWWNAEELAFLICLRDEIEGYAKGPVRDLLLVAFCRTMMSLANVAFNHQSLSFKDPGVPSRAKDAGAAPTARFTQEFLAHVEQVAGAVTENPKGRIRIEHRDARRLGGLGVAPGSMDLLITSPPYPNRMSYIRELRPYLYWLGFLGDSAAAGELDWAAIGGTWGIATSRLRTWKPTGAFVPDYLSPIVARIRMSTRKNAELMARYVHKYFDDMFSHFVAAAKIVRPGGSAHYIVGNSTFYGQLVPTEQLYCDQLARAGFRHAQARVLRKRNSKRELVEYHVIAER